jgi:aminopeptidase N
MGPIRLGARLHGSLSSADWSAIVYGKGTWIIHMLRRRLGDEKFLAMLGELAKRYRYKTIGVAELQQLAVEFAPKDSGDAKLEGFFGHWVDSTGIPALTLKTSLKGKAPNLKLTLTVAQSGVDPDVSLIVPVDVQLTRTRTQTYWVATGADTDGLTIPLRAAPVKVTLDPGDGVVRN